MKSEGGIFRSSLTFPPDYPQNPPKLRFLSDFWHPNGACACCCARQGLTALLCTVYPDGTVCISILHPPVDDPTSGESLDERWTPAQSVETILISVISMLSDANTSSPANVDASVEFRKDKAAFRKRVKQLVEKSLAEKPADFKMPEVKKPAELSRGDSHFFDYEDSEEEDFGDDDEEDVMGDMDDEEEDGGEDDEEA